LIRNSACAFAPLEDAYLVYNTATRQLHRLNPAAALILELCDGTRHTATICSEVAALLGPDGDKLCTEWIQSALAQHLVLPPSDAATRRSSASFALLAQDLRRDGQVLAAFVCQEHAAALKPERADYWYALGELAHILGRRERARAAYEEYISRQPDDAEVAQILIALRDEPPPSRASDQCIEQLYARFADVYEDNMHGDLQYQAPERLKEALEKNVPVLQDLNVLELGCGTGLAGQHLRRYSRQLVGLDLSPEMIARARLTGLYDALELSEITAWLNVPRATRFDLIVACDTLIYFGDLRQVIVPASRLLIPGGFCAFTVERGENFPFRLTDSGRYSHTAEYVREVAPEAGLSVISLTEGFLRNEYGEPVTGLIALLQKGTQA
jgi:predicted TPR repeat methyltransferase